MNALRVALLWTALAFGVAGAQAQTAPLTLDVVGADVGYQNRGGSFTPLVSARLSRTSTNDFARFTRDHVDTVMDVLVGDRVVWSPTIREPILGGSVIVGFFASAQEAQAIADSLKSGAARLQVRAAAPR